MLCTGSHTVRAKDINDTSGGAGAVNTTGLLTVSDLASLADWEEVTTICWKDYCENNQEIMSGKNEII